MKTRLLSLLVAGFVLLSFSGCDDLFDDGEITYDGPQVVEFKPLSNSVTLSPDESAEIPVAVQLIGEQRNEELTVNYVVDEESSAEEGVHYSLPNSSSVTIPADSSSAVLPISAMGDDNLDAGDTVQLILELQGSEEVEAAENLKVYTLTIQGGASE